jgi:hypothetical protein
MSNNKWDELVGEARDHLHADVDDLGIDWAALEKKIEQKIDMSSAADAEVAKPSVNKPKLEVLEGGRTTEAQTAAKTIQPTTRRSPWLLVSGLAAAAALLVFAKNSLVSQPTNMANNVVETPPVTGGPVQLAVTSVQGSLENQRGTALSKLGAGDKVQAGDRLVLQGQTAAFSVSESVNKRRVGEVVLTANAALRGELAVDALTGESLGLSLVDGQVATDSEKEVVLVVGKTRVQSQGSSMRVARHGKRLRVELRRGSFSVKKNDSTDAARVIAGAQLLDLDSETGATLPIELGQNEGTNGTNAASLVLAKEGKRNEPAAPEAPKSKPEERTPEPGAVRPLDVLPKADPKAQLTAAIRQCVLSNLPSTEVHVSVKSTLHISVDAQQHVTSARFSPPLSPEAQACAAKHVFATEGLAVGESTLPVVIE